eukprot:1189423-Prorocentrum_minimum.AAC.3
MIKQNDYGSWFQHPDNPSNSTASFRHVIPSPSGAEGIRCSVSRLTHYPPLQHPPSPPSGRSKW